MKLRQKSWRTIKDDGHTKRYRNFLKKYNDLLAKTYIDLDLKRYIPDPRNPIYIELNDKIVRRIFSHGVFTKGGRFYGGFWQKLPEELRDRLIVNGEHVVEIDFSGMMVHILYAMVGKKLGEKQPYVIAKSEDVEQTKLRDLYKKLLVAGCNAEGKTLGLGQSKGIKAVRAYACKHPDKYPALPENDSECYEFLLNKMKVLKKHHPDIAHFIGSGQGVRTQRVDSDIAYKLLTNMTNQNKPVLCIHDSFVCRVSDRETVYAELKKAYVDVLNSLLVKGNHKLMLVKGNHKLRVTERDVVTSESTILTKFPRYMTIDRNSPFHVLSPLWSNTDQYVRQRLWIKTNQCQFYGVVQA